MLPVKKTLPPRAPSASPPEKLGGVMDRIKPMASLDWRTYLLWGQSGTGKTTLWSTFPGKKLVVLCSGGRQAGELNSVDTAEHRKNIDEVALSSTEEIREIAKAVSGPLKGKYSAVILDHVTGFQDLKFKEYKGIDFIPQKKKFGEAGGVKVDRRDWSEIGEDVCEKLATFISVPCNRVIVGQERVFLPKGDDDDTKTLRGMELLSVTVGCGVIPGIAKWLHPACDYNIQTFVRQKLKKVDVGPGMDPLIQKEVDEHGNPIFEFCARIGVHDVFMVKFRTPGGVPANVLVNPSYAKLMKILKGEKL